MDNREQRLPAWARQLLEEERTIGALAWPTEARPVPLGVAKSSDYYCPAELRDRDVWRPNGHAGTVQNLFINASGIMFKDAATARSGNSFGSRPSGPFFATEREARIELWWQTAEAAALNLLRCKRLVEMLNS